MDIDDLIHEIGQIIDGIDQIDSTAFVKLPYLFDRLATSASVVKRGLDKMKDDAS